ncbi:hypothetical protein QVD17_24650 [Tagetes erecta]|uniref:Sey1/RHD3-like three-helix bundle domain-containing protein n=1 Tax=Tagetes erecta TaxID=13708 RepID=A0AAD8KKD6_TARER|nr:hypothetical protein QVD17_24650 [Tagetes erecta]
METIKEKKSLELSAQTIMVATIRCDAIASGIHTSFAANKDWLQLKEEVKSRIVPDFGKKLSSMLESCLSIYDKEVIHYDASVVSAKRKQLLEKLLQLVQPTYELIVEHILSEALDNFKTSLKRALDDGHAGFSATAHGCVKQSVKRFDELCKDVTIKQANLDTTKIRLQFSHDLKSHIFNVQAAKLSELTTLYKSELEEALSSHVQDLLELCGDDTWPAIRRHLHLETEQNVYSLYHVLSSFEMQEQDKEDMLSKLKHYGRKIVERKAKYEARKVLGRMKERFAYTFNHDNESKPRVAWTENEDIPAITKTARTSVPASLTLITPVQCKSLWDQFKSETQYIISQATASQEAYRQVTSLSEKVSSLSDDVTASSNKKTSLIDTKNKLHQDVWIGAFTGPIGLGIARLIRKPE